MMQMLAAEMHLPITCQLCQNSRSVFLSNNFGANVKCDVMADVSMHTLAMKLPTVLIVNAELLQSNCIKT